MRPPLSPRLLAALAVSVLAAPAMAQEIGTAGAVNPAASGTPPARATRVLELGARVISRERIRTTAQGNVQLIFIDKTTLNIGPNSDLVIDEFVYDPNAGTGRMAASLTRGVLRFVGGNTSHTGGATIKTPAATLGIRGGVATVKHNPCDGRAADAACGTRAINHFGTLTVTTAFGSEIIRRPGFVIAVASAAVPPSAPQRVSQAEVDQTNRQLTSGPRQSGGAKARPTEAAVVRAGVGAANAGATPSLVTSQQQVVAGSRAGPVAAGAIEQGVQQLTQQATTQSQENAPAIQEAVREQQQPARADARAFALVTSPDPALNSSVPYVLGSAVASGGVTVSPVLGYRVGATTEQAFPAARTLQTAIGINGQGSGQTSTYMVSTGEFGRGQDNTDFYRGSFGASSETGSGALPRFAGGTIASVPGSVTVDRDRIPRTATINQNRIDAAGAVISNQATVVSDNPITPASYSFQQSFAPTEAPASLGQNRPERTLVGFTGGLVSTKFGTTDVEPAPFVGTNQVTLDPGDSRVQVNMQLQAIRAGETPGGAVTTGLYQFGSVDRTQAAQSAYIDYDNFGANQALNPDPNATTALTSINGGTTSRDTLALATAKRTDAQAAFPGVTFCQCEFTRWGYWSAESLQGGSFSDRVHLGTWVAGQVPNAVEVPTVGTASYTGHVVASVRNGAASYVAAGSLVNTLNFGTRAGVSSVTGFDGRNYTGPMVLGTSPIGGPSVGATAVGAQLTSGSHQMLLGGSLYRGPTSPVGEMGGIALVTGPAYSGAGTFAARINGAIGP